MGPPGDRMPDDFDRIPDGDLGQSVMHNGNLYLPSLAFADGTPGYADPIGSMTPVGGSLGKLPGVGLALDRDASKDFAASITAISIPPGPRPLLVALSPQHDRRPEDAGSESGCGRRFQLRWPRLCLRRGALSESLSASLPSWVPSPYPDGDIQINAIRFGTRS